MILHTVMTKLHTYNSQWVK